MDLAAQQLFDDPNTDPIRAFGVGAILGGIAGPLAHNPATQIEAGELIRIGNQAMREAGGFIGGGKGNAGAALNTSLRDSLIATDLGLTQADVATAIGGRLRQDVTGQMTTSEDPLTRLVGQTFFEETAGFKDHSVVPDSVSVRAEATEKKLLGNLNATFEPALREYLDSMGASRFNLVARARAAQEFRQAVHQWAEDPNPSPTTPKSVARAGQALRDYYGAYREEIANSGLMALKPDKLYVPKYADHARIAEIDNLVHQDVMEQFIRNAVLQHAADLDPDIATRVARGYWRNIRRAGYGIGDDIHGALGMGDKESFKRLMQEALSESDTISDADLEKVFNSLSGLVDQAKKESGSKGISRLKARTLLDYNYGSNVRLRDGGTTYLRMNDLFVKDAEFVARRYGRQMSGRIAFANTQLRNPRTGELLLDGIKSEGDLAKLKDMVRESWRQLPGGLGEKKGAMQNALDNIDFGWARINGIPVYGQEKAYNQWVRRLKAMQFIRLMSNMGLNQVQESWKLTAMTGFRAAMTQLPAIRRMVDEAGRSKPMADKLLTELEAMTGTGLDGLFGRYSFRFADDRIGATTAGKIGNHFDNALDFGQQLTSQVSLMRSIHEYQQRWAVKAISQQMLDMARRTKTAEGAFDLAKLRGKDAERLASIGIGEKEANLLFKNLLAHAETDGKRLVSLGSNKWDPEALTKFTFTLNRYTNRLIQKNDVGGLSKWMSVPVLSLFTQFRSFVFGAWAKSTLYSLHHMDARMLVMLLGELAAGVATYVVRRAPEQWATQDGRDKFWEETMNPVNLLKNGWARTATSSILPMIADSALMFTPLGPQFGSARSSGSPSDAVFGSPVGGQLKDAATFSKGAMNSALNDREMTQGELRAGWRTFMPGGNFVPLSALFSHMIEDRPTSAR